MPSDEQTPPLPIELFRLLSPGQRLALTERMFWMARQVEAAWRQLSA